MLDCGCNLAVCKADHTVGMSEILPPTYGQRKRLHAIVVKPAGRAVERDHAIKLDCAEKGHWWGGVERGQAGWSGVRP